MSAADGVLVFTVALNGYAGGYRRCLASQRAYAERHGFRYVAVTRPLVVRDAALAAWLKLTVLREALAAGSRWVAFVDSDAAVTGDAPDFTTRLSEEHDVHMALGRSGRLNSGVIVVRNSERAREFVEQVLGSLTAEVADADRAGLRFENGNVIACARGSDAVGVMDPRWNNTHRPRLDDHIRHYTGDLRRQYRRSRLDETRFRARRAMARPPADQPDRRGERFAEELGRLTRRTLHRYPALVRAPRAGEASGG